MTSRDIISTEGSAIAPVISHKNSPPRILVVDDDRDIRQLSQDVLAAAGYEVEAVKDGAAGWETLQAKSYDLVITDNQMPRMTGIEMIEKLRAAHMAVAVIMATGHLPTAEFDRKPELKPDAFLKRPFSNDDLLRAVKQVLRPDDGNASRNETRTEQALRASELSYRRLFEAALDGIMILDVDTGLIHDVNPFLVGLLGFSHEDLVGASIWDLGPHKDIEANKAKFEQLQQQGCVRYENLPLEAKNGRLIAVEFVSNVYQAGDRNVIQCNVRDITKRKFVDDALHASELSYRRLFETARDGILILDVDTGRINDVNPFLVELLGFSHGEMVGKTVGELSPFKDIEENKVMLARLQKDGYVRYEDLPLETKDGRKIAVEFVSNVYQAGYQKVIQCNVRDITERKAVEMQSKRLAAIVESSDDAIIGKDPEGIITSWNKGAERIFGYTASEIIGTTLRRLIPAGRQDEETQILEKIKRGESVQHFETLRQTKDGRLIAVSVTASPIKDAAGKIIGVSKVTRDITARKEADEKIRQLNVELEQRVVERTAQLQAANEELEAFSYSVSHDLRAPLRHVIGFVQMLEQDAGPSLSERSLGHLNTISNAAKRMGNLIDDLLTFARVGRSTLQKAEVNLDQLVQETSDDFKVETKERKIVWNIHPLPRVRGDRALLRLVLVNLISNAVKFTGARAEPTIEIGEIKVERQASSSENSIALPSTFDLRLSTVIYIRDNGAGFDPRYADKLFGVFQRLHSQDEFAGTGIGLANVQRIIARHGGRVWAEGVVDGGATFYFSIPKQLKA